MAKTVKDQIEEVKDQAATNGLVKLETAQNRDDAIKKIMLVGGIKAVKTLAEASYLQVMLALKNFQETEGYKAFGYDKFDVFLDDSPHSPMSKSQYYERKKVLDIEGGDVFELLNSISIPISTRKALKKGEIAVEGEYVIVGDEEIPLTETQRIKTILKTLSDRTAQQKQAIEKGKAELKAKTKQLDELATGASVRASEDSDSEPGQIYMRILSGFANLEREIAALSPAQQKVLINEFTPGLKLALQSFVLFGLGEKQAATDDLDDLLAQAADEADD
jgi:hypothetical protein